MLGGATASEAVSIAAQGAAGRKGRGVSRKKGAWHVTYRMEKGAAHGARVGVVGQRNWGAYGVPLVKGVTQGMKEVTRAVCGEYLSGLEEHEEPYPKAKGGQLAAPAARQQLVAWPAELAGRRVAWAPLAAGRAGHAPAAHEAEAGVAARARSRAPVAQRALRRLLAAGGRVGRREGRLSRFAARRKEGPEVAMQGSPPRMPAQRAEREGGGAGEGQRCRAPPDTAERTCRGGSVRRARQTGPAQRCLFRERSAPGKTCRRWDVRGMIRRRRRCTCPRRLRLRGAGRGGARQREVGSARRREGQTLLPGRQKRLPACALLSGRVCMQGLRLAGLRSQRMCRGAALASGRPAALPPPPAAPCPHPAPLRRAAARCGRLL